MIYLRQTQTNRGQVMLVIVVLFLLLSMTIIFGIANPVLKQASAAEENLTSLKSYYAAESAVEDVYIRLQKTTAVGASETFALNGGSVNVTTSATIAGKQVIAEGNVKSNIRKLTVNIDKGTGIVFKYGTQSGQGGFIFDNNAVLNGSLYSNGPIVGSNGSYITGDAISAGLSGVIDNVDIGTGGVGNGWAYTIRNLTATGVLYCQSGASNNKACNTSGQIPDAIALPITDAQISQWKTDAAGGGTITGDTTISSPTSMGPKKIVGNLTLDSTLTLSNTLYVTGNILINNGGGVKLSSTYGASSGVIIADGYIVINNNSIFQDSGTVGSYILLLSQSTCDQGISASPCSGHDAINVGNNSSILIANAQKGTVYFSNNASVKEAVGNIIHLKNNSIISYGTGVTNPNFTSGPGGGYNITYFAETQ